MDEGQYVDAMAPLQHQQPTASGLQGGQQVAFPHLEVIMQRVCMEEFVALITGWLSLDQSLMEEASFQDRTPMTL